MAAQTEKDTAESETVEAEVVEETLEEAEERDDTERLGEMENAALAVRERVTVSPATMPSPNEWEAMRAMAETIARTEFVPRDFRGRPEAVLAAILSGRELGIGPMQSLKDISIIDGRPALAAHLVLAMLRRGGVEIVESGSSDSRAFICARRRDTGELAEVEWTMEEADKAGLAQKPNFKKYPADMLWARCVGRLGRRLGSDLLAGMPYTAEEVQDFDNDLDGPVGGGYVSGPIETRKVEGVGDVPVPVTWPEIEQLVRQFGDEEWEAFLAFIQDTAAILFATRETTTLSRDERAVLRQKASGAAVALRSAKEPDGMPPVIREDMAKAFASVLDGVTLPGPVWRFGPAETDRPLRTETEAEPVEAESAGEEDPG